MGVMLHRPAPAWPGGEADTPATPGFSGLQIVTRSPNIGWPISTPGT
jgi:hypothetical protein